jgi:hypothetical protein
VRLAQDVTSDPLRIASATRYIPLQRQKRTAGRPDAGFKQSRHRENPARD